MTALPFAALGLFALLSAAPAVPAPDAAPVPDAVEACPAQDFTPADAELLSLDLGTGDATQDAVAKKPKCQECPDRPWCPCTYEGQPRISCDPCCFRSWNSPFMTCFD